MCIEPEDGTWRYQTAEGPDGRIAVATQNQRKPAGSPGVTDARGKAAGELKSRANLGGGLG